MAIILNIETATTNCSVSVAKDGALVALKEHNTPNYSHSEQLHVFIEDCLVNAGLGMHDLNAVAVSKGPGSYTGLRIGVSAAKGLCFSLDIPLISIPTLESMAHQIQSEDFKFLIPVLDARRMEVYSAIYDHNHKQVRETRAQIIEESSFGAYSQEGEVLLLGSGATKCSEVLKHPNFNFNTMIVPSAKEMAVLSHQKFLKSNFENVAYFEPYYLKDFMGAKKK